MAKSQAGRMEAWCWGLLKSSRKDVKKLRTDRGKVADQHLYLLGSPLDTKGEPRALRHTAMQPRTVDYARPSDGADIDVGVQEAPSPHFPCQFAFEAKDMRLDSESGE
nr:hypothetical protein Iba_chr13aCG2920 [Ipomoea batatas]